MKTNNINLFCDIVTQRSGEHSCAINILLQQQLYGQVISILRQELDSMVRVMFLLSISDLNLSPSLTGKIIFYKFSGYFV
ncbi:hypothetical protein ABVC73_03155 [Prevotella melaninogenica]